MVAPNDADQLCNDCHASRNVSTSALGSHPVGLVITTGIYYKTTTNFPFEGGTTNIGCMTCHAPHRSPTTDGSLLRMTNDNMLCNSCHTLANTSSAHFSSTNYMTLWPGGQYGSLFPARSNAALRGTCAGCHFVHGTPNPTNTALHNPKLLTDFEENTCFTCHDSNGPSVENVRDDFVKKYDHPVGNSDGFRRPGRSVECTDCHNPHKTKIGVHDYNVVATVARNDATNSPVLAGVDGVAINYSGLTNFQVVSANRYSFVPDTVGVTNEYEICFKCHSGYGHPTILGGSATFTTNSATVTGSGTAWTTNLVGMWIANSNDVRPYVITAVASATSLTISPAYAWATGTGTNFFIRNTPANETPYYGTGTATFTPGSANVNGTGTSWNNGMLGSWIYASNRPAAVFIIVAVNNATNLTIYPAYR